MPHKIATRCCYPGCGTTTHGRFCEAHAAEHTSVSDERRGSPAERGYDERWRRVAALRREADCGLCQHCLEQELETPSNTVDHIIPVHVCPHWRLEVGNTQVLCAACHTRKTNADTRHYGSSTACVLSSAQRRARNEARAMTAPPRGDPAEESS